MFLKSLVLHVRAVYLCPKKASQLNQKLIPWDEVILSKLIIVAQVETPCTPWNQQKLLPRSEKPPASSCLKPD